MQLTQCAPWVYSSVLHTSTLNFRIMENAMENWQLSTLATQSRLLARSACLAGTRKDTTAPRVHVEADKC